MKTERNILIVFILNLAFSLFEFFGGIFTDSIAIISDAIHDIGDTVSIGISYFFERKSKKHPDEKYTYGYARYSVIGGIISTLILLFGSTIVIYNAIRRIVSPVAVNYDGMIYFALIGVSVNAAAAFFTRSGISLNQKAVNLHMLEDMLGWIVVLVGAIVIKFTDFIFIDPIMSIGVAIFILINAAKTLIKATDVLLEKSPYNINVKNITEHITSFDDVIDVHHIHIWTLDGEKNTCATMHIVTNADSYNIKKKIRSELRKFGINHVTLELESDNETCDEKQCRSYVNLHNHHCHCHH